MDKIYFTTVEISGKNEDNRSFYLSYDEAKKDTDTKIHEEIRNVQKLISDYSLDVPIFMNILKNMTAKVNVREYVFQEEKVS